VSARRGFSLTEVIVAMTLLAVTALGVAATALVAVQSFASAELQERTLREAEQVLDSLVDLPSYGAGVRGVGPAHIRWPSSDSTGAVNVLVTWPDHTTLKLVAEK
jgi:prepilin-type N-terminal cleavage/methylation domain-containing protein